MFALWIFNLYVLYCRICFIFYSDNELISIIKCALVTSNIALLVLFVCRISTNWAKYDSHSHECILKFSFDNIRFFEMTVRLRLLVIFASNWCLTYQHHILYISHTAETVFPNTVEIYSTSIEILSFGIKYKIQTWWLL